MLFVWLMTALRKIVWLVRIPKLEEVAKADLNERCPVCGHRNGRIRCVLQRKPGPQPPQQLPQGDILRQHACNVCGARWHHSPLAEVDATKVLPSVARTELEAKEDRLAFRQQQEESPSSS